VGAGTRTRLPRAEREQQMLAAARGLFAERGYAAVTMDDVATAVGVTKPLLYTYFGNKERLFAACMEPAGEALLATVVQAVQGAPDGAVALERGVHAFFAFVDEDREAWGVLFDGSLPSGELARSVVAYRDRLAALVAAELAPGGTASPVDEALTTAVLGAAEALGRWWLRTGAMSAADAAELLIGVVKPGLGLTGGPPPAPAPAR